MAGRKRKNQDYYEEGIYSNKSRSRPSVVEARLDPTYGQRSAIPGLDDDTLYGEEDGYIYDEETDALAYLRSVRQEAFGIPNLLVAPKSPVPEDSYDMYQNGVGDFRGRYEDGAYLAEAEATLEDEHNSSESERDSQTLRFDSILLRYQQLRARLSQPPPNEALQSLGSNHPNHVGPLNKGLSREWVRRMQKSDPKPAQIASMTKSSVLRLLRLLTQGTTLKRGPEVDLVVSYWVWSLLAKLPERGELNSEEIGVVRELGKKAVLIGMGLKEVQEWQEGMQDMEAQFEEDLHGEETLVNKDEEIDLEMDNDNEEYAGTIVDTNNKAGSSQPSVKPQAEPSTSNLGRDAEQPVSASSQTLPADTKSAVTAEETQESLDGQPEQDLEDIQSLAAMKAHVLERLSSNNHQINIEPQVSTESKARPPPSKSNTRATVDMIITVAGEVYGQRDLLEFRHEWAHIM